MCTCFTLIVSPCFSSRKMAKIYPPIKILIRTIHQGHQESKIFCHVFQIMTEDSLRGGNLFQLQAYHRNSPSLIVTQGAFDTREHLSLLGSLLNVSSHN